MSRWFAGTVLALLVTGAAAPAAAQGPQMQWQRISEQREGAFTVEVPQGWQSQAFTWRRSPVDFGHAVIASSPDGMASVFLGDGDIPVFTVPNSYTQAAGLREGMRYDLSGVSTVISRYKTGTQAAVERGGRRVADACKNPRTVQARDLPQESRMIDFAYAQGGMMVSLLAGEASFQCSLRGAAGAAYVFAGTQKFTMGNMPAGMGENAMWLVNPLAGFIATSARAGNAAEVLIHLMGSFAMEDRWVQGQNQTTMTVSTIVANTNTAITKSISDSFWYRRALEDRIFARGSQARRGVSNYYDPVTRRTYELTNLGYKWINSSGQIVTTTTQDPPGPGFRLLQPARPR